MKTVSFVVPFYNPPLDLFRGLLDQSGVGIEIVAVNDGSTNGAINVLRECDANLGEDQPETARWTIEAEKLFYANKVWYRYNLVENSLSREPIPRLSTLKNALRVNAQLKDLADRHPDFREWLDFLSYTAARKIAAVKKKLAEAERRIAAAERKLAAAKQATDAMRQSISWRLTAPMRAMLDVFRRRK